MSFNYGPNLPPKPVQPPKELTKDQRKEWHRVIASLPTGWFSEFNAALLVQYVRHVSLAAYLAKLIAKTTDTAQLIQLAKLQQEETACLRQLMSACRMTQRSTRDRHGSVKKLMPSGPRPWEKQ